MPNNNIQMQITENNNICIPGQILIHLTMTILELINHQIGPNNLNVQFLISEQEFTKLINKNLSIQ